MDFESGTIHWLIRSDGVLGLTVIGHETNQYQICASKPRLTLYGTAKRVAGAEGRTQSARCIPPASRSSIGSFKLGTNPYYEN